MRTNESSAMTVLMKTARGQGTQRPPRNRHKRYYLPGFLSCRLTTSQRPSEFAQQLAVSPIHPSQPFPSVFILIFRSLCSLSPLHLPNAPLNLVNQRTGTVADELPGAHRLDLLTFFLRSLTSRYGVADVGLSSNQSFPSVSFIS